MSSPCLFVRTRQYRWGLTIAGVGLAAFAIAAMTAGLAPFSPCVHDEFSYLLAADTLLQGRLANPTPEVWQPFQSFHILVSPAYVSKYPLGQGMIVALGWWLFGTPVAGCWLAAALCAATTTWMLAGITGRRWAVAGGLLLACHPAMQSLWSQTLMSGWLAAAGSTLLAGSVFRLRRRHSLLASLAGGCGIGLLAVTRPFEGLVATCISAAVLWGLWHGKRFRGKLSAGLRIAPIAGVPIAVALSLIAMQNYAISGRLSEMPYQLHEKQYAAAPLFVFGQQKTPELAAAGVIPKTILDFHHGWSLEGFRQRLGARGWLMNVGQAIWTTWRFWVLLALVPILSAGYWIGYRLPRLLVGAIVVQILCSAAVCWIHPHYLSPLLPWLVALSVLGLRRIYRIFVRAELLRLDQTARFIVPVLAVQSILLLIMLARLSHDPERDWGLRRSAIAAEMQQRAGDHLVLVHYAPQHNVHEEWVYNLANLERAKVLWARGERDDWNEQLRSQYARSRFIWELKPDEAVPRPVLLSAPSDGF